MGYTELHALVTFPVSKAELDHTDLDKYLLAFALSAHKYCSFYSYFLAFILVFLFYSSSNSSIEGKPRIFFASLSIIFSYLQTWPNLLKQSSQYAINRTTPLAKLLSFTYPSKKEKK
ncbi:hypothetical protein F4677DRAFT_431841 [Hypoxylon crocopeplum]|nr:hypothetical protein F4677DRAFT_431841 [Hypoxylon crocopeplum]